MLGGRLNEVKRRAKHLWAIENSPMAATALWVLGRRSGDHSPWNKRFERLKLGAPTSLRFQIMGCAALGALDEAHSCSPGWPQWILPWPTWLSGISSAETVA